MEISFKKNDNTQRQIVMHLANSLRKSIDYKKMTNNAERIENFTHYIFSRFSEKFTSIAANYIKLEWNLNRINFNELDHLLTDDSQILKDESDIELISTALRPLTEIYLELKAIELTVNKYNVDLETSCILIYHDSITQVNQLKRNVSMDVYGCDPKFFKKWCELNLKELNRIKHQLHEVNIPILKNLRSKYKSIIENYDYSERLVLGFDYFSHYAILSKKAHFSYTNIYYSHNKPNVYLAWCVLYMLLIHEIAMRLLNKKDEVTDLIKPLIDTFKNKSEADIVPQFKKEDLVLLEFGSAKILNVENLTYELEYQISNCFETGETDFIPKIFIIGRIDRKFFKELKEKVFKKEKNIYTGTEYDKFYEALYKHAAPKEQFDMDKKKND